MQQYQTLYHENVSGLGKVILIVEDDAGVGNFLLEAIKQETHYHAYLVTDAFQAIDALQMYPIDLIILDYSLPQMNGIELYDKLSLLEGVKRPPIVMISAHLPINELAKRKLLGMRKPLELEDFLNLIEDLLSGAEN